MDLSLISFFFFCLICLAQLRLAHRTQLKDGALLSSNTSGLSASARGGALAGRTTTLSHHSFLQPTALYAPGKAMFLLLIYLAELRIAIREGAKVALDGRKVTVEGGEKGFFLAPTILDDVNPDMHIARVEAFGPVVNLMRPRDLDEALDWINNKDAYGHSACIFTRDGGIARRFMKEADVGNIGINVPVPQPFAFFPLGSKNESALGVAKSRIDSMRLFLDQKTVTERWT